MKIMQFDEIKEVSNKLDNKLAQLEILECKLNTTTSIVKNGEHDIESKKAKQEIILLKIAELSKVIDGLVAKYNLLYKECSEILNENKYKFTILEKNVVEYYYLDNLDWNEVKNIMKISKGHVWRLHRQIRKKIERESKNEVA